MDIGTFKERTCKKYRDQMFYYLRSQGLGIKKFSDERRSKLKTAGQVRNYQKLIKEAFVHGLSDEIYREKIASSEKTGVVVKDGFIIEKAVLTTDKGVKITTNIYKPENITGKLPAILFLCGHSFEGKAFGDYQKVETELVRAGFIVLAVDAIGKGERFTYYNKDKKDYDIEGCIFEHAYFGAKAAMTGKWVYNYFMRDMLLALDYLAAMPEVDADRIGVTGNSGGGTQTSYMMLMQDERLKAFAPATFITDYMTFYDTKFTQDDEQIVPGIIGAGFSYPDIIVSVAPKPVMLLGVNKDFFPIEGMAESYLKALEVYKIFGKKENLTLAIDHSEHRYTVGLAKCVAKFFAEHLMGNKGYENENYSYAPEKWETLNCYSHGQISLEGAVLPDAEIKDYYLKNRLYDLEKARKMLKEYIYKGRKSGGKSARKETAPRSYNYVCGRMNVRAYFNESVKGIKELVAVYSGRDGKDFKDGKDGKDCEKTVMYFTDGGNAAVENNPSLISQYIKDGYKVIVTDLSNYGYLAPEKEGDWGVYDSFGRNYYYAHHFFFRGDCYAAFRSFEILSAIGFAEKNIGKVEKIYAGGLVQENVACALFAEKSDIPVCFTEPGITMEKIITERFYNDRDIRSVIYPGLALVSDFDVIKNTLNRV